MASAKALAAIALTLIIAVPIGLGYMFASHEVEVDEWESVEGINLTNAILNTNTPYFMPFGSTSNNSQLLERQHYISPSATEWHTVQPDYVTVSGTYTSIPTFTSATNSITLGDLEGDSGGVRVVAPGQSFGSASSDTYTMVDDDKSLYRIYVNSSYSGLHYALVVDGNTVQYGPATITAMRAGNSWTIVSVDEMSGEYTATDVGAWRLIGDANFTVLPFYQDSVGITSALSYSFVPEHPTAVTITHNNGTIEYDAVFGYANINWESVGRATVDGREYLNVASMAFATGIANETLYYDVLTPVPGLYANPSDGWHLPEIEGAELTDWWTNNHLNQEVRMMVSFSAAGYAFLGPVASLEDPYTLELHYTGDGDMIVTHHISMGNEVSYTLGTYSKVMIVFRTDSATVYGINAWPSLGATANTLNQVTIDYADVPVFSYIYMDVVDTETVKFRVDQANIVAGYFPSTKNFNLNMGGLYPDKSYTLKFNSIGIYGDSINIGSQAFGVTNGRINVNGLSVALKGAVITSLYDGAVYKNTINGQALADSSAPASIYFGGEWSLTITGETVEEHTNTRTEWAPGEFAFDDNSFKGAIVLAAVAAFIGVGLYGARSGVKVGLLILICGGAALVAMIML